MGAGPPANRNPAERVATSVSSRPWSKEEAEYHLVAPTLNGPRLRCLLLLPTSEEYAPLRKVLRNTAKEANVKAAWYDEQAPSLLLPAENLAALDRADLVIAEVSKSNPRIMYEVGLAHARGKPTIFLAEESRVAPFDLVGAVYLTYKNTLDGLEQLRVKFAQFLKSFIKSPRKYSPLLPGNRAAISILDLDKLEPREFENFCFELLTQMGFRRVEWGKELREFDAVAMLRKQDPDGFEYEELWLISMGIRAPITYVLEMGLAAPERFLDRILQRPESLERFGSALRMDTPVTLLFIMIKASAESEMLVQEIRRMERRLRDPVSKLKLRIRVWDSHQLTNLAQQYPQITQKYFSEEGRSQSKYRKTPEELYNENVRLTERFQATVKALEEEKDKRARAERDAVWKELSFTAAHKLGNPIFAIETNLEGLKKRIPVAAHDAVSVATEMQSSVEKAKSIIQQFKSLTKALDISPRPTKLTPLVERACQTAKENGVSVSIEPDLNLPDARIDPDRITECFDELVANAMHWLDKEEKTISVRILRAPRKELPDGLDTSRRFIRVCFADNGCGVTESNKKKIFDPFFTTYIHGTGLGLALVQRIIQGHGGWIREVGKPGDGAKFELYLPEVEAK